MRLWLIVMVVFCAAFLAGGCGGSADSSSDTEDNTIANDMPDTYNTQDVLNGTWIVIDQDSINITVDYSSTTMEMRLITASLTFSNTNISGTSGVSFVTSHETWHAFLEGDVRTYMGVQTINIDNQVMSMIQSEADIWRCELYDQYRTVMNITILSPTVIQVSERRIAVINDTEGVDYEVTFTMKKQN